MAIIVSVIMSQSHTSQWSSVVYRYDFMFCEDARYLRAGPRHGEVPPRGESKSAAPQGRSQDFSKGGAEVMEAKAL